MYQHIGKRPIGFVMTLIVWMQGQACFPVQPNSDASKSAAERATNDSGNLRVGVTDSLYDDIPSVLNSLDIPFRLTRDVASPLEDFHLLFIGCTTTESFPADKLQAFVERGGVLYVSDLSYPILQNAFPKVVVRWGANGVVGKYTCRVLDREMVKALGKTIELNFDAAGWAYALQSSRRVKVLVSYKARKGVIPVLFTFNHGRGKVVYTSFHNHANASLLEQQLINQLVLTPLEAARQIQSTLSAGAGNPQALRDRVAARRAETGIKEELIRLDQRALAKKSPQELLDVITGCDEPTQLAILNEFHTRKGSAVTTALTDAVDLVSESIRQRGHELLAQRLTRMTSNTLKRYLAAERPSLQVAAARAIAQKRDRSLISELIDLLVDSNDAVANAAHEALKEITRQDFGELAGASTAQRFAIQQQWKKWHGGN